MVRVLCTYYSNHGNPISAKEIIKKKSFDFFSQLQCGPVNNDIVEKMQKIFLQQILFSHHSYKFSDQFTLLAQRTVKFASATEGSIQMGERGGDYSKCTC